MKRALVLVLKFAVTIGIFVGIFLEFGGGFAPVDTVALATPGAFAVANPAYPGIVGRLRARIRGTTLPPARLPATLADVCKDATEHAVFVRTAGGELHRFKPLRHCTGATFTTVYREVRPGKFEPAPIAEAPAIAFVRLQGFQLVPAELSDLWAAPCSCPGSSPPWR